MSGLADRAKPLLAEADEVLARMPESELGALVEAIAQARRVLLYGQGRTGLVMQALAMRLYHLGLEAHVVGAMTAPPVATGDLFLVNAATGDLPTGLALMRTARGAGARVALVTARPESAAGGLADLVLRLPAQTLANDLDPTTRSAMPMGSQYELVLFLVCELLVLDLSRALGTDFAAMRGRHANLL